MSLLPIESNGTNSAGMLSVAFSIGESYFPTKCAFFTMLFLKTFIYFNPLSLKISLLLKLNQRKGVTAYHVIQLHHFIYYVCIQARNLKETFCVHFTIAMV